MGFQFWWLSNLFTWHFCRTTEWTFFWDSSGMTHVWLTVNILMIPWIWIPLCWILFGSQIYSLPTRREQISMMSQQTTSCWGFLKLERCCTVSGKPVTFIFFSSSLSFSPCFSGCSVHCCPMCTAEMRPSHGGVEGKFAYVSLLTFFFLQNSL